MLITPDALMSYKLLGQGLGTGTVAARSLVQATDSQPEWAETEWSRVLLESGPILGLAYLILRASIVIAAYAQSLQAARGGNLLPIALFGAAGPTFLTGQFGQPTSQGGAAISMGLCLAALSLLPSDTAFGQNDDSAESENVGSEVYPDDSAPTTPELRRGRSIFSETLHRK